MKRRKPRKRWTKLAQRELFNGVGISGIAWFKRKCGGRSVGAVYHKLQRDFGLGGLTRGAYTVHELETVTGYSETQLRRGGSALNQKWKRLGPRGAHIITEEQMSEIVTWLGHDYWSKPHRLYGCLWCTTEKRAHQALGLCGRCYHRYRRACIKLKLPATVVEQSSLLKNIKSGKFLDKANSRLNSGIALDSEHLVWLAMLAL